MKTMTIMRVFICTLILWGYRGPGLQAEEAMEEEPEFIYAPNDKRDPFWPLVNSKGMIISFEKDLLVTDLMLEGIFVGEAGKNVAIINGKILQKNESIGVFTVKDIKENRVTLQKGQERVILKLKKED